MLLVPPLLDLNIIIREDYVVLGYEALVNVLVNVCRSRLKKMQILILCLISDLPDYTTPEECSCNIHRRDNLEPHIPIRHRNKT